MKNTGTSPAPSAANYLGLPVASIQTDPPTSISTLRHWIATGKLKAYRPGRRVLVRRDELMALLGGKSS